MSDLHETYEGLDDLATFADPDSLARYRAALLERTAPQADFLAERLSPAARLLEIGCGNGRLLIELARRNAIEQALGVDLARSRIAFAERWASDAGCGGLEFLAADALRRPLEPESFDATVCITGAFAYFEPGEATALASKLYGALRPGGLLCLELYPHPAYLRLLAATGGEAQIWTELPAHDPWRFYLSRLSLEESGQLLVHEKTFIHRTTGQVDAGRHERLWLYTEEALTELVRLAGFHDIKAYEGWSGAAYAGGEVLVLAMRK